MSHRHNELDVTGTLTTYLLFRHLHTASVTGDTLVEDTLIFTARALIVLRRTEDALTEQSVTLGLVRAVVNGLRLGDLTIRIFLDLLGRSKRDGNLREISLYLIIFFESHIAMNYNCEKRYRSLSTLYERVEESWQQRLSVKLDAQT